MKILVLISDKHRDSLSTELYKNSRASSSLDVKTSCDKVCDYDKIFVYTGFVNGKITDECIKECVSDELYSYIKDGATLLIPHHYSCDYSLINFDYIVISKTHLNSPYQMLKLFAESNFIERKLIKDTDSNFIMTCDSRIFAFISSCNNTDALSVIPVIPISANAKSNFCIEDFFGKEFCDIKNIRLAGDLFWKVNYYNFWDSFYDTLNRH